MVCSASVVNHTFDEMNKTRQLKVVKEFSNKGLTYTNTALHLLQRWTNAFNVCHQWDSIMDQLESLTDYFLDNHQAWKTRRGNVEIGRLTESILPPDVLFHMLNLILPVSSEIISPVKIIEKNGHSGRSNAAKSFERPERRSYSKIKHCHCSERRSFITRK